MLEFKAKVSRLVDEVLLKDAYDQAFDQAFEEVLKKRDVAARENVRKLEEHRKLTRLQQQQALQLSAEQTLEIFSLRPSPSVSIWRSSGFGFDESVESLCTDMAKRYGVSDAVIQSIWLRKSRICTTRPHWTDKEIEEEAWMSELGIATEKTTKRIPTHQKSVTLNLWAQKYLELEAELEAEFEAELEAELQEKSVS